MNCRIVVRYRVTTPMFCHGADPEIAEFRLPSFRGMLRFWWRACAWSRHDGDVSAIREEEDLIFGSTRTGQGRVRLSLLEPVNVSRLDPPVVLRVGGTAGKVVGIGVRYLGYGLMEAFASSKKGTKAGQLTRGCLVAPFEVALALDCRRLEEQQIDTVIEALEVLGLFGAMGARSRKGFGSLSLVSIERDGQQVRAGAGSVPQLVERVQQVLTTNAGKCDPYYSAFSKLARAVVLEVGDRPALDALDLLGRELVRYRSWGRRGRILGGDVESERNFQDDHDLMKLRPHARDHHPRRIAFGLPHNYGKKPSDQVAPAVSHDPAGRSIDRRASPLFFHVHDCGGRDALVVLFLPAEFLPAGARVISVGGEQIPQKDEEELYRPVEDFLDRLASEHTGERFEQAHPIWAWQPTSQG